MKTPRVLYSLWVLLFFLGCILPASGHAAEKKDLGKEGAAKPIVITSRSLEVNGEKKVVTFTGDVHATKDDFVVDCQKMLVYYRSSPDKGRKGEFAQGIDRIVASGQVRVTRKQGGLATSEKAVYYQADDKLVLTGHPSVKQGKDVVTGDRIIVFLKENRTVVESKGEEKAQAVIFPKARKKETP